MSPDLWSAVPQEHPCQSLNSVEEDGQPPTKFNDFYNDDNDDW